MMRNQQPLNLLKQGVATTWNKWREEHTGTAEPGKSGAREPEEYCQPNGGIIPQCGRHQSSGRGRAFSIIPRFGCQKSLGGR